MSEVAVQTRKEKDTNLEQQQQREPETREFLPPAVDIYETNEALFIRAEMPGLTKENIEVSTEGDVLTIKGVQKQDVEHDYTWREFGLPNYSRQFRLSNKVDQGKISAEYKHGVLEVKLPHAEEAKPRQIDVKVT